MHYQLPLRRLQLHDTLLLGIFMRRITPATYEIVALSGVRWHRATNKSVIVAVLRNYIIENDIDCLAATLHTTTRFVKRSCVSENSMVLKILSQRSASKIV